MTQINASKAYKRTVNRLGLCLLVMLGLMSTVGFIPMLLESILAEWLGSNAVLVIGGVAETVCYMSYFIVPAILFYTLMGKYPTQPIRFKVKMPWTTPLMIISGMAIILFFAQINAWVLDLIGYESSLVGGFGEQIDSPAAIVMYMTISFAPAIAEEILFRGVVFGNLRPYGRGVAIMGSAVLFGLMHQTPEQIIYTIAAGIVLALVYEFTGSIWCCTFLHLFNNLYSVIQSVLFGLKDQLLAQNILLMMDIIIYVIGAVSLTILFAVAWHRSTVSTETAEKADKKEGRSPQGSWFGAYPSHTDENDVVVTTHSSQAVIRPFVTTPGMLIYIILTILTILLTLAEGFIGGIL